LDKETVEMVLPVRLSPDLASGDRRNLEDLTHPGLKVVREKRKETTPKGKKVQVD
jgi:hypothetical protein